MADKRWTAQQIKAIEADGNLTVLSAAAGSGKTTVLVEKAVRMLLDENKKIPADSLLIVTFSNASAKEFKNRIEKRINEEIKKNPENSYIRSQKLALQRADISTIHSFCIKLARENFEALDMPPDFTICDEQRSFAMHEKAIDYAMEQGYRDEDFCRFVTIFGKSSQDKQIREFLRYMYEYFSALPFPEKRALQLAKQAQSEKIENTEIYKFLWKDMTERVDYIGYLADRMTSLMYSGGVDSYRDGVLAVKKHTELLKSACDNGDLFLVKSLASEKTPALGRMKKGEGNEFSEAVKSVNDILKKQLRELCEDAEYLDGESYARDNGQTGKYIKALTDVFVIYSRKLAEIKNAEKSFEFSDFEHFAVKLLIDENGERTALAKALQQKYVKIMEDEFQDTSYVQDMIFKTIARDEESNLFVVGDVKQSIYGFRKASPAILLEKRSRHYIDPSKGTTVVLPNNFRSEVNVIEGVNCLFSGIMTEGLGGVNYRDGEQLLPAPGRLADDETGAEIIITNANEAGLVAQKISDMVASGYKIKDGKIQRPVTYSDFCILLRNKSRFGEFAKELKARGIKAFIRDDEPLLEKPEIQSIIALLKVINNPMQEVYLTAGMFGDIFDFTLDDILHLKLKGKKENLYKLLSCSDEQKAVDFLEQLKDFSFAAQIYSPDKLVDYIVTQTGYYTKLAFSENGSIKRDNIRRFTAFAKRFITDYQNCLSDFLRYIDLTMEAGKTSGENTKQPPGTVAVMTMHNSKGLEFPICFVSGLGTAFNKTDRSKRLMIDPVMGMATYANNGFGYNRSTAGIAAIRKKILRENANDEMRLLYVALTRAKNKNFLTAQYTNVFTENSLGKILEKTDAVPSEFALRNANTPMEWILTGFAGHPALTREYNSDLPLAGSHKAVEVVGVDREDIQKIDADPYRVMSLSFAETVDEIVAETDTESESEEMSFDVQRAKENLGFVYPNLEATRLPIKVSVGEVAKAPHTVSLRKPFFAQPKSATAAQKGTQMHLFAQHCDIAAARSNVEAEMKCLAQKGVLDKNLLDKKQIEAFLMSPVADIIQNGEKVYKEKDFLVAANARKVLGDDSFEGCDVLVQGVIDCLVINGTSATVIDYKTDRVKNVSELYKRYEKQLEYYRFAAESLYEISDVKCIIYSFYLGDYIEF